MMKLIYTNENRFLVSNIKNVVQDCGIEIVLKNEYIAGGAGDLSPFDTWLELWVVNERDYPRAMELITGIESADSANDWVCNNCHETNSASFDICWKCQNDKPSIIK
jgi:putative signal transducing protein